MSEGLKKTRRTPPAGGCKFHGFTGEFGEQAANGFVRFKAFNSWMAVETQREIRAMKPGPSAKMI